MNAASPRQPDLVRTADRVIAPTYTRPPVVFEDGDGCWLRSQGGDRYLDLTTGIAVTSLGHGNATVRDALHEAADGLLQRLRERVGRGRADGLELLADYSQAVRRLGLGISRKRLKLLR